VQVRLVGLAQSGKRDEAVEAFQSFLHGLTTQSPNFASETAQSLAPRMQLAGDREAALAVCEKHVGAFFLNTELKDWCDRRTKRPEPLGQPAPAVTGESTSGATFEFSTWTGKVVLVDFWSSHCRPCLEDLPQLEELHAEVPSAGTGNRRRQFRRQGGSFAGMRGTPPLALDHRPQ
jgi:thiol-disulfide isomerase/thioredoxin